MNDILAEKLLAKIMEWEPEDLVKERFQVQMFADIKYNNYQQYSQGMRYVESLALWLKCFDKSDRSILYNFLKENLIYISEKQMRTLVEMSYPFYIKTKLLKKASSISKKPTTNTEKMNQDELYNMLVKKSLFLGLSDGSHIDLFRRANTELSNEQICVYYDMSKAKFTDMLRETPTSKIPSERFVNIFLLDDFSGSGISFIRKEGDKWKGKIIKFLERLKDHGIKTDTIDLLLLLYISTSNALEYINTQLSKYKTEKGITDAYNAEAIQIIDKPKINQEIKDLLKKYYEQYGMNTIEDSHYKKGDYNTPFLGFNAGSLPLVIYHNTPNNAIPIIWFNNSDNYYGLFPRVTRHKDT